VNGLVRSNVQIFGSYGGIRFISLDCVCNVVHVFCLNGDGHSTWELVCSKNKALVLDKAAQKQTMRIQRIIIEG
jgi:hypothetical protein